MEGATEVREAMAPEEAMGGQGAMATTAQCPTHLMGGPLPVMGGGLAVGGMVMESLIIHMEGEGEGGVPMATHREGGEEVGVTMAAISCC